MRPKWFLWLAVSAAVLVALAACGDDDDLKPDGSAGARTASPTASSDVSPTVTPEQSIFVPPLEGPPRTGTVSERTDFRQDPEWALPKPEDQPAPDDSDDPILNPPAEPAECPTDWQVLDRPVEGFKICYPPDWVTDGQGYVAAANEERWYSVGIYDFPEGDREHQRAHISVYVVPTYTRPLRYTLDCPELFSVTLAGQPAVVCPDFPAESPEARISSYHVFREDLDYFVQVVEYFEFENGEYTDSVNEDARDLAIQTVQTFQFTPVAGIPSP